MAVAAQTPSLAAVTSARFLPGLTALAETARRFTVKVCCGSQGIGSGIVWSSTGAIVTNAHVIDRRAVEVEAFDGRRLPAVLIARSVRQDLALLRVAGLPPVPVPKVRPGRLRVGELVIAMGNPLGLTGAVSVGVVHALGLLAGFNGQDWIQADVQLAPGNSGGPLIDAAGRVLGVNTMIVQGLGVAIPAARVRAFLEAAARQ